MISPVNFDNEVEALERGCFDDIFGFLGAHCIGNGITQIRAFKVDASDVELVIDRKSVV